MRMFKYRLRQNDMKNSVENQSLQYNFYWLQHILAPVGIAIVWIVMLAQKPAMRKVLIREMKHVLENVFFAQKFIEISE